MVTPADRAGAFKTTFMQKVQIAVVEKTTKLIDVEMPSYYLHYGMYTAITEQHVIQASDSTHYIASIESSDSERYAKVINEAMSWGTPTTKDNFSIAFDKCIKCLTEQYQSSIAMHIEPKDQVEETKPEQAAEGTKNDDVKAEEKGEGALVD